METYQSLYTERQRLKNRLRKIKYDKSLWREYVSTSETVKEMTVKLKELCKVKPTSL